MKASKLVKGFMVAIASIALFAGTAVAEEEIKGKIKSIDLGTDTVVLMDKSSDTTLVVQDKAALDQIKAGKIKVGNKVKAKYIQKDGKNTATYFKKLPGC